jgi:crotonobetainyl-CoA:carnitine CoA-transferase CaiB-like acyl-CoA transferase
VRIADFSLYLPGPYATRLLADLGADVIKVEPPSGDPVRLFMPGLYEFLNRGKRVIAVDLKVPDGVELAHRLIGHADVVIEGFRPGVADRLGIGFEQARALRPDVIYSSMSGYGQSGSLRERPGHDQIFQAGGGAYGGVLAAGMEPAAPHMSIADLSGSLFAALTITAQIAGSRAGRTTGAHHDVAIYETLTHLAATKWATVLRDGVEPTVAGMGNYAPGSGLFRTRDRWVILNALEDKFWNGLCTALGCEELRAPPYDTHELRMRHRAELRERIAALVAARSSDELIPLLAAHDVPVDLVRTGTEVIADPHFRDRGLVVEAGLGLHLDYPVRIDTHRPAAGRSLPSADDAGAILRELGISADREAELRETGALRDWS